MPAIDLPFPIRGVNRIAARDQVPELQTLDAKNVVPYDAAEGQLRGGQRAGTERAIAQLISGVNRVQGLRQITLAEGAASGVTFGDPFPDLGWAFANLGALEFGTFTQDFTQTAGPSDIQLVERDGVEQITFPDPDDTSGGRDPLTYDLDTFPSGDFTLTFPAQRHYVTAYWSYDDKGTGTTSDDDYETTQESQHRVVLSNGGTNTDRIYFRDNDITLDAWSGSSWSQDSEVVGIAEVATQSVGQSAPGGSGLQYDWPEVVLTFTDQGSNSYEVGITVGGVDYTPSPAWTVSADAIQLEQFEQARQFVNGSFDSNIRRRSSFAPPKLT